MTELLQAGGAFCVVLGLALLLTPWVLIVAGVVLLVVPELAEVVKR